MWDVKVCRCCLSANGKLERFSEVYRRIYATICGLEITVGDGYPAYVCVECHVHIKKTLAFRRRCRRAFFVLKEIMTVRKEISFTDIETVDRKKTNLASPYDIWKPDNNGFYTITTPDANETDDTGNDNFNKANYDLEINPELNQTDYKCNIEVKLNTADVNVTNTHEIVKYVPIINNTCTYIVTDIKSADYKEIIREEIEDETFDNEPVYDDNADDVPDIDLEDVFKDLKEPSSESEKEEEVVPMPGVQELALKRDMRARRSRVVAALSNAVIRLLTLVEQKAVWARRQQLEPFKSALYKCGLCITTYSYMKELTDHVTKHMDEVHTNKFSCLVCQTTFATAEALNIHGAEKHWYLYTCKTCGKKRNTLAQIRYCNENHKTKRPLRTDAVAVNLEENFIKIPLTLQEMPLTLHSIHKKYRCCKCPFVADKLTLRNHVNKIHGKDKTGIFFECDMCGVLTRRRIGMKNHMKHHLYKYKCLHCPDVFYNMYDVRKHSVKHRTYACQKCNKTFKNSAMYAWHLSHYRHGTYEHCPQCGTAVSAKWRLYAHQLREHKYICVNDPLIGEPAHRCLHCDVQFINLKAYQQHVMKMSHKAEAKMIEWSCYMCRMVFDSAEEYEAHNKSQNHYPRPCAVCQEPQTDYSQYAAHCQARHPDFNLSPPPQTHLCELCGKRFTSIGLVRHKPYHTRREETLYQCKFCPMRPLNSKVHVCHMLARHTHRPYLCTQCPLRFHLRVLCRDHILKVHAPCFPYECEECGRRFSHQDFLNSHSVKAHGKDIKKELAAKHAFLSRRMKGKFYVYPHMKIDCTFIDPQVFNELQIGICDYMDQNEKPVANYRDYIVIDDNQIPLIDEDPYRPKAVSFKKGGQKVSKRKRYDGGHKKTQVTKIKRYNEDDEEPNKTKNDARSFVIKGVEDCKREKMSEDSNLSTKMENELIMDEIPKVEDNMENEEEIVDEEYVERIDSEDVDGEEYEVIEKDGKQLVLIKGTLYQIESGY